MPDPQRQRATSTDLLVCGVGGPCGPGSSMWARAELAIAGTLAGQCRLLIWDASVEQITAARPSGSGTCACMLPASDVGVMELSRLSASRTVVRLGIVESAPDRH
jgi:hypothetical protein